MIKTNIPCPNEHLEVTSIHTGDLCGIGFIFNDGSFWLKSNNKWECLW